VYVCVNVVQSTPSTLVDARSIGVTPNSRARDSRAPSVGGLTRVRVQQQLFLRLLLLLLRVLLRGILILLLVVCIMILPKRASVALETAVLRL